MKICIIVLLIINLILVIYLINKKRQVKSICRQLWFYREKDSNLLISCGDRKGGMGELADELNLLAEKIRATNNLNKENEKNLAEIYTNLSHDIRTPLTSLYGYFQLLQECDKEEDKARYISIIQERIDSLNDMLDELFTYTKLKNHGYQLELTPVNYTKIIKEIILSYYEEWTKQDIRPEISICDDVLYIMGEENSIKRTIQNIVKNVLEHGTKRIIIDLAKEDSKAHLKISNCVNNPEEIDISRVFERFYKGDEARGRTSSGLGLSIAYGFVEKMNGDIFASLDGDIFTIHVKFDALEL